MCIIARATNKKIIQTSGDRSRWWSERRGSSAAPRDTPKIHLRNFQQLPLEAGWKLAEGLLYKQSCKKDACYSCLFSDRSCMKPEINYRNKKKKKKHVETKQHATKIKTKQKWVNEEAKKEIRKHPETDENRSSTLQQRQFREPLLVTQQHRLSSGKKESLKEANLPPGRIRTNEPQSPQKDSNQEDRRDKGEKACGTSCLLRKTKLTAL